MSRKIEITFELNPPNESLIPPRRNYDFPLATDLGGLSNSSRFYKSLRDALAEAKAQTGEDLTTYRDMAADSEKHKISMVKPSSDDEEEEETEE
ncbi:hypothetical protein B0J17DRAFT_667219 [Rhizoctonia solani]|nr:hypothetical protein B0J17DRAFT_667219 [Rhizoctonia solani]